MKKVAVFFSSVVLFLSPIEAFAHQKWANGDPIPAWVKAECCGPADAHHLNPNQVHATAGGFKVDGYGEIIPQSRLQPSPDGEWWIFYKDFVGGEQSTVYCFFGPNFGS